MTEQTPEQRLLSAVILACIVVVVLAATIWALRHLLAR